MQAPSKSGLEESKQVESASSRDTSIQESLKLIGNCALVINRTWTLLLIFFLVYDSTWPYRFDFGRTRIVSTARMVLILLLQ